MKCKTCNQEIKEFVKQHIPEKTLEWGEVSEDKMTWEEAKEWCESKGYGWRLPTRVELIQAFDEGIKFPEYCFWSSTETYNNTANAWPVFLYFGNTYPNTKSTSYYVRMCRTVI